MMLKDWRGVVQVHGSVDIVYLVQHYGNEFALARGIAVSV